MITPLQHAAWSGDLKAIRELLDAGAEIDERTDGLTPLMFAAKEAKLFAARQLLKAGANVNAVAGPETPFQGMSPLCLASVSVACVRPRAVEATVQLLLRAGAHVDHRDADGWTPLMSAVARPRGHVVELLLAAGANPNARSRDGVTPLIALARTFAFGMVFAQKRVLERTVSHLLQAGASVDRKDSKGWTALLHAAAEPRGRIVGLLLAAGADPNVQSRDGVTPLTAMERRYRRPRPRTDETTRLLLAAGAKG
jgi:ankyrin repeat protein